jgi:hypothetical protein
MKGAGNAVHFVPSKWIVDCPTAQISFGEEADAASRALFVWFSFGVGTTLKIDPGLVCDRAGVAWNMAAANPKSIAALNISFTISPRNNCLEI